MKNFLNTIYAVLIVASVFTVGYIAGEFTTQQDAQTDAQIVIEQSTTTTNEAFAEGLATGVVGTFLFGHGDETLTRDQNFTFACVLISLEDRAFEVLEDETDVWDEIGIKDVKVSLDTILTACSGAVVRGQYGENEIANGVSVYE